MSYPQSDPRISSRRSHELWDLTELEDGPLHDRLLSSRNGPGFYGFMLLEDVSHLLPWGRGLDDGFTASMEGDNPDAAAKTLCEALPTQYGAHRLAEAVRWFCKDTAKRMVGWDAARYEIEYLSQDSPAEPTGFRLAALRQGSYGLHKGKPVQFVPPSLSDRTTRDGLHYVELEAEAIATFALHDEIRAEVRDAVALLAAANETQTSRMELLAAHTEGYDVTAHAAATREAVLRATRAIGWDARGLGKELELDPYVTWRQLRFSRFKAQLRETILAELNRVLSVVGPRIGQEAQLRVQGAMSVAEFDTALDDLENGRRPLAELVALGP